MIGDQVSDSDAYNETSKVFGKANAGTISIRRSYSVNP